MVRQNKTFSLESDSYVSWCPPEGESVEIGADRRQLPLPLIPLPIHREDLEDGGRPTDDAVGRGLYDYLRQFPDCAHNADYAELLREAFPHYLADLGAQIVLLDHKEVDAPYVQRKITYMKILSLLDPNNGGLLQQLGKACFELAHMPVEFSRSRYHLLAALGYFRRSLKSFPSDPASLNYLGQIDFILGDYPGAARYWANVVSAMDEDTVRHFLKLKLERIDAGEVPDHPLIDDLEAIGEAMELYAQGGIDRARMILDRLEEDGAIIAECPSPEFFYLLGMCRGRDGDAAAAFEAFDKALEIDPDYAPAREGKEKVLEGGFS